MNPLTKKSTNSLLEWPASGERIGSKNERGTKEQKKKDGWTPGEGACSDLSRCIISSMLASLLVGGLVRVVIGTVLHPRVKM